MKRLSIQPYEMDHLALVVGRAVICIGFGALWVLALWVVA